MDVDEYRIRLLKSRIDNKNRKARYKAAGKCVCCARNDAAPGRARCQMCLTKDAEKTRLRKEDLLAAGLCQGCKGQLDNASKWRCKTCLSYERMKANARKAVP